MFNNYLKIAFRNFSKERFYASINVLGLALGIASSLLITLYVVHELSYDDFHPDEDETYRVNMTNIWYPESGMMSSTILPLAGILKDNYPEIKEATRINTPGGHQVRYENNGQPISFYELDVLAADSNFFDFFGFKLKEGNPETALKGLNKVVISEETALRYFGDQSALNKVLLFGESKTPVVVSGVTEEQPTNSHFDFDFLISMYTNPNIKNYEWSWIWTQAVTYVKIDQATDIDQLHKDFEPMARIHAASAFQRLGMDFDEFEAEKGKWRFKVEPVRDIHLNKSGAGNRIGVISDESYIYIFSSVALLVILLAMINFMNLSTARAAVRAKEIGVRKAMGSLRNHLISQFLIESIFMSTIATLVGLGLMEMIKITTQQFVDIQFHISLWDNSWMIIMVILLPIVLGIISGLYPAFYLTRFKPSQVLKGQVKSGTKSLLFRNVLVYLQFTISITLMASTAIVYNQLQYVNNADLGFDRENVLVVNWADKLGDKIESFQNSILSRSDVQNVSISMDMIGRGSYEDVFSRDGSDKNITMAMLKVDDHFLQTMGMELIKGRAFAEGVKSDVQGIVINTAAMEALELSDEDVLGSKVDYFGQKLEIIGVVNDFNYQSLRREIAPFVFVHLDAQIWGNSRVVAVRSSSNNPSDLIDKLEQEWEKRTDAPFQYSFLDKEFENRYLSEQKLGSLFAVFTVFAMIIACLGLLGLAAYTVSQRNKEIGIRKVLGASAYRLVVMLNGNYSKLVLLSIITAVPLSWWGMSSWLEQFAYKNEISWVVYLLTGLGALAIAWITVGFQSLKAALVNPVDSLRNE